MDLQRTGNMISAARKAKGLTQKQLAQLLHISDRTISKWERGAGFPDVALLMPLADSLDISVISLLQGEHIPKSSADITVGAAITLVYQQTKAKLRQKIGTILTSVLLFLFLLAFVFTMLDYSGVFLQDVVMEIPVGVYVDGVKVGESSVAISGKRRMNAHDSFAGRFAIASVEKTCRERVTAYIEWDDWAPGYDTITYSAYGGPWKSGVANQLYISSDMTAFAVLLDDGTIIATDDYYVPLLMSGNYYPLKD